MAKPAPALSSSARRAASQAPSVDHFARAGLVAYGAVHLLVGWLAIQLVVGGSGEQADNQGAIRELADTPLGRPLLWLLVLGFAALVIWQLAETAAGPAHEDDDRKRAAKRVLSFGKAVAYGAIGISAAKIASGGGASSSDSSGETFTAKLMGAPAGQVLVALVGLAIVGGGLWLARKGISDEFRKKLDGEAERGHTRTFVMAAGRAGHVAKGVAYGVLGVLFVAAAVEHDPKRSGGLDDALKTLLDQPLGSILVPLIGIGFAAYGVFCFARAKHLRRT
ncbi:MAG: DUF1206 domain-containing protein [Patulibacter minatonensis]